VLLLQAALVATIPAVGLLALARNPDGYDGKEIEISGLDWICECDDARSLHRIEGVGVTITSANRHLHFAPVLFDLGNRTLHFGLELSICESATSI
jgi:hypothetical protein